MHSEASTPLDVPETPHHPSTISRCWPLPLYPTLATASLSNIMVGFPYLCSCELMVDRLALYCSSLYNGAWLCLLHSTWQHWHSPTLWARETSLHAQGSTTPGLIAICLGHA